MPRSTGIEIEVHLEGLARALRHLGLYRKRTDRILERVLDRHAIRFHRQIVINITNWPAVDTGWYRNSVTVEKSKLARSVGPTAEYSQWVELGTSKMKKRPSTLPAWRAQRPTFLKEMGEAMKIENVLRGVA